MEKMNRYDATFQALIKRPGFGTTNPEDDTKTNLRSQVCTPQSSPNQMVI